MRIVYLIPFSYFFNTRLRYGSISFHFFFEWLAAFILLISIGEYSFLQNITIGLLSYLAFISLYEIGYLYNDLVASKKEVGGRKRGPQDSTKSWLALWFFSRFIIFFLVSFFAGFAESREWWSFFIALLLVFSLHNILLNKEIKPITFIWLAWFRFMAPVIFVLPASQIFGVSFSAAMTYMTFRMFGYLDSKDLLVMPNRQSIGFRFSVFTIAFAGVLSLWSYPNSEGFVILTLYFITITAIGILLLFFQSFKNK